MSEFENFLKNVEERLRNIDDKIKEKLDGLDATINAKLKARGFGWDADADENAGGETNAGGDTHTEYEDTAARHGAEADSGENISQTRHSAGSDGQDSDDIYRETAKKLEDIAPYLDDRSLHNMVWEFLYGDLDMNMTVILPFLSDGDISLLTQMLLKCDGETFKGLKVKDILPFAKEEDINAIFIKRAKSGYLDKEMMPFVGDKCWHEIVKEYCKAEDSNLNIDEVYPYLDDDDITLLFKTYLKRQKKHKRK